MEEQFLSFIDILVVDTLHSAAFIGLPEVRKQDLAVKLQERFYKLTFEVFVDELPAEQLYSWRKIQLDSKKIEQELSILAQQMPFLLQDLEEKLVQEAERIKLNPYILTHVTHL